MNKLQTEPILMILHIPSFVNWQIAQFSNMFLSSLYKYQLSIMAWLITTPYKIIKTVDPMSFIQLQKASEMRSTVIYRQEIIQGIMFCIATESAVLFGFIFGFEFI